MVEIKCDTPHGETELLMDKIWSGGKGIVRSLRTEDQGIDIVTIDVRNLTSITDYMIICTGRSTRQVKALADNVAIKAKENEFMSRD